jgi:hypothetical protein
VLCLQPVVQEADEVDDLVGVALVTGHTRQVLQRRLGHRVGARRSADAEVDPARVQGSQRPEHLGHLQGAVVRQQHAA